MKSYPKLPTWFKRLWLSALRSGHYKQGAGALCGDDRFCCLGVALDLICPEWNEVSPNVERPHLRNAINESTVFIDYELLPLGVRRDWQMALSRLNDNGHTFEQIADWIEHNL